RALSRAWAKTGNRIAAKMAMIAITTSSSISVKPKRRCLIFLPFQKLAAAGAARGAGRQLFSDGPWLYRHNFLRKYPNRHGSKLPTARTRPHLRGHARAE